MALGAVRTQQFSGFYSLFFFGMFGSASRVGQDNSEHIVGQFQTWKTDYPPPARKSTEVLVSN
jgi:hypothetical protein